MDANSKTVWMVGLDLTEMDDIIIQWVNYLSSFLKPEVIYFIHVERDLERVTYMPDDLMVAMASDERLEAKIKTNVRKYFTSGEIPLKFEVIEGKPFDSLIHWSEIKKIDLFIAGRKHEVKGGGILPHKLARKLHCSILFIPEVAVRRLKRILLPVDFSEHSRLAIQAAGKLKELLPNISLHCLHIYQVPTGYYKTGKSFEEFGTIMEQHARKAFNEFMRPIDDSQTCLFHLQTHGHAEMIHESIKEENSDLVILGSKGQTNSALLLLGSTAEKLIRINDLCPTWVIKKKDENIGLIQALRHMP